MNVVIRPENPEDIEAIDAVTVAAFLKVAHSSHTEQLIIKELRRAGALTLSLVAVKAQEVVGHVALSPVILSTGATGWYGLGPLSVMPAHQRQGIGAQLMRTALAELRGRNVEGCVVLGDPRYYARFDFRAEPSLVLPGVPPEYFQALAFRGEPPSATVAYHHAFAA